MKRRHFGTVRKLPSGRYQAFYWHEGRTVKAPQTYQAKADALGWLNGEATDIARGTWAGHIDPRLTVSDLAERWKDATPTKRRSTRKREAAILRKYIVPALGTTKLTKLTRARLQEVVDSWVVSGLAPSTVGNMASCLAAMFNYAVDAGLLSISPANRLRLPHRSLVERPILGPEDLERVAGTLGDHASMMWLGVVGGLRWGECAGLTVGAIDPLAGTITVAQQLDDGKLSRPKSEAGCRKLAIPSWLVEDLAAHLFRRGLTAAQPDALVFVSAQGMPLLYPNWHQRVWRPACQDAGLPGLRFHDLRSMAATALVAAGVDVRTAQTRLGHSSPAITLGIYARSTAEADRRAADAVGASLRPDVARRMHAANS